MKFSVKQMYDWNHYAYIAEDVDSAHWYYFINDLWWQVGNSFIRVFDNVAYFSYCAENFEKYGETFIKQQLKLVPAPWERTLSLLIPMMKQLGVDWYIHGSTAMALWGIDVKPKDIDIIIPNVSDFDRVRDYFYKMAIKPFERCDNWLMSGLGTVFLETAIGFAFHNADCAPFDMETLGRISYHGKELFVDSLKNLREANINYNRLDRVAQIDVRINSEK